jgi:dipeptidyl aminopeptidase/acylaminoacyl peptidase
MRDKKTGVMLLAVSAASACLVALVLLTLPATSQGGASEPITRPVISEDTSPLELISPIAQDGYRGQGFLRKPPGAGPFPALVWIHGGFVTQPLEELKKLAFSAPNPSRFLAAGYVVAVITYRSREEDPQSKVSLKDSLAAVDYLRRLPYVDPKSIVVYGCSGGGDLALEIAADTDVAAIAPEEPATGFFTGVLNKEDVPQKKGERRTAKDVDSINADPKRYYTAKFQKVTREKIERIHCPILIVQGDITPINHFNAEVMIPELRTAGKNLEVITYPGETHCFAFYGCGPQAPRPGPVLKVFHDVDTFFRRHLRTQPKPLDPELVKQVPDTPPK